MKTHGSFDCSFCHFLSQESEYSLLMKCHVNIHYGLLYKMFVLSFCMEKKCKLYLVLYKCNKFQICVLLMFVTLMSGVYPSVFVLLNGVFIGKERNASCF